MNLLNDIVENISPQNSEVRAAAMARIGQLTMPHWALGRVLDLAVDLAGMASSLNPPVARKTIVTMAGDHGVVAEGVSRYPQEVTVQMVGNFVNGGAGINVLARLARARNVIVDMGVKGDLSSFANSGKILSHAIGKGTANMCGGAAMSREDAVRSVEAGIRIALDEGSRTDVFGTGDMGIGNTTPSSAIIAVMTGSPVESVTGLGTGIEVSQLSHKVDVIKRAIELNQPCATDALDVLAKVGGFEIGGIAGLILGAASLRKPVLVDGVISTAGALVAYGLNPLSADYMVAAHRSVEKGQHVAWEKMGKSPLLDLGMRLGEGTGAALAMNLVDAAVAILTEMATFEQASVSKE